MANDWTPVVTGAVTVVGTLGGVFIGGMLQSKRERSARLEERKAMREAEIDAFEREQVQHLQDGLLSLVRICLSITVTRIGIFRATNDWPSIPTTGRAEEYTTARFNAMALAERMLVPALKDSAWLVINRAGELMGASDETAGLAEIDLSAGMSEAMKHLGARLGELYRRSD